MIPSNLRAIQTIPAYVRRVAPDQFRQGINLAQLLCMPENNQEERKGWDLRVISWRIAEMYCVHSHKQARTALGYEITNITNISIKLECILLSPGRGTQYRVI